MKVQKKEEMENLKKQFQDEQRNRQEILSRKSKTKGEVEGMTLARQQKLKQLELDEQMMNQEDEFF